MVEWPHLVGHCGRIISEDDTSYVDTNTPVATRTPTHPLLRGQVHTHKLSGHQHTRCYEDTNTPVASRTPTHPLLRGHQHTRYYEAGRWGMLSDIWGGKNSSIFGWEVCMGGVHGRCATVSRVSTRNQLANIWMRRRWEQICRCTCSMYELATRPGVRSRSAPASKHTCTRCICR